MTESEEVSEVLRVEAAGVRLARLLPMLEPVFDESLYRRTVRSNMDELASEHAPGR